MPTWPTVDYRGRRLRWGLDSPAQHLGVTDGDELAAPRCETPPPKAHQTTNHWPWSALNRTGFCGGSVILVSNQCVVGLSASVGLLELCWRYVAEVAVEALGVVPVHPGERGEFDVVDVAPRALGGAADQFGLVEADNGLGEGVDACGCRKLGRGR